MDLSFTTLAVEMLPSFRDPVHIVGLPEVGPALGSAVLRGIIGSYVMWTLPPKGRGHQAAIVAQIERSEWRPEIGWVRDRRARPDAIARGVSARTP
jgi:hypothetical protein